MIRLATHFDIYKIESLWKDVFADDFDFFKVYKKYFDLKNSTICVEDEVYKGMAHFIPCMLSFGDEKIKGLYIFSVAVSLEYRGRGIASQILAFLSDYADSKRYDFICLIPANESLFKFYYKFGYEPFFYIKKITPKRLKCNFIFRSPKKYDLKILNSIYESFLKDRLFALRTLELWSYIIESENVLVCLDKDEIVGYVVYAADIVYEVFAAEGYSAEDILSAFACRSSILIALAPAAYGEGIPFGCVKFCGSNRLKRQDVKFARQLPYMNLLFNT